MIHTDIDIDSYVCQLACAVALDHECKSAHSNSIHLLFMFFQGNFVINIMQYPAWSQTHRHGAQHIQQHRHSGLICQFCVGHVSTSPQYTWQPTLVLYSQPKGLVILYSYFPLVQTQSPVLRTYSYLELLPVSKSGPWLKA